MAQGPGSILVFVQKHNIFQLCFLDLENDEFSRRKYVFSESSSI